MPFIARTHATCVLTAATLLLAGCKSSDGANADVTNRIYVVAGATGAAAPAMSPDAFVVTLDAVDPAVDWYTDRPARSTGEEPPDQFIGSTWTRAYGQVHPNALLQYRIGTGIHGLFGSVSDPRYDPGTRRLTVTLTVSRSTSDVGGVIGSFDSPVLTILNNLAPPAEGSSYALHTGSSQLEADGAGGYRLVVSDVDERVFAMNNAPGRAGDFETVSAFVDHWDERFGYSLPNGSLAGDVGGGTYEILPLTLSSPAYEPATRTLTFAAIPLPDAGAPALESVLRDAVLFVDSGPRATSSTVFSQTWRGFAYSAVPGRLHTIPQVKKSEAWDSDMTSDNFLAQWGTKDGCGRDDLQVMADAGVNVIRLYDYNYARDASAPLPGTAGHGHIAFLDKAQALGIKVIIPVSNWNFSNDKYAWENIKNTVTQIVNSTKKGGAIHPAVHSFSVGNELDLGKYGLPLDVRISRAIEVVGLVHQQAPDHYVTIPISNADEKLYYGVFKSGGTLNGVAIQPIPGEIYRTRFYNSVQTFKLGGTPGDPGNALERDILKAYDDGGYGVPLMITELGMNNVNAGSAAQKVDQVVGQAQTARAYLDAHPSSLFKGFCIFEWQNSNWKRDPDFPETDTSESTYGIHAYDGSVCNSTTGPYLTEGGWVAPSVSYGVDRLVPLTSPAHPEGLLKALTGFLK